MAALRELVLKLSANTVEFRRDLNTAVRSVNDLSSQMERSFQSAKNALVGFAAAVASVASLDALAEGVRHTAEALADLDDMSQKTGSSVENLSRLAKVAHAFGGDAAAVNVALNNLARGMAGADEESDKTRQALEALGITTDHIAERDPSAVFIQIAKALQQYHDGAAKAAVMTDLFKKSGVDLLPYMNNVANGLELFSSTSEEAAQQGTRFNNQLRLLHVRMDEVKEELVSAVLPVFGDFLEALNEIGKDSAELAHNDALSQWAQNSVAAFAMVINAAEGAVRIVSLIGHQIAALLAMVQADGAQARKAISDAYSDQQDTLLTKPMLGQQAMALMEKVRQQRDAAAVAKAAKATNAANAGQEGNDQRPTLNYGGMNDKNKIAELIKHQAEAEIHALEALIAQEKQILESRNRFLDYYNTENLLSFNDYFTARQAAQAEQLSTILRYVDAEIAANRKIKQSATTESALTDAQSHINELLQKKIELQRQGSEEALLGSLKEAKAYQDLSRELRGLQADLLDLQGKAGEAAKIRVVDQDRTIRLRLTVEGNENGLALLDTLEKAKIAQAEFNQLTAQAALIQDRLHNEEERAAIAQYSGAASELDTLLKVSASRQQAVSELEAIVLSQERVAEASNNPALVNQANAARTALEKLRAESHLLEQRFRTVFVDSMSTALSDFVLGTKSARQAFKEFADSVVQQITRMASEAVSQQLFQALMGGLAAGKGAAGSNGSSTSSSGSGGGGFGGGLLGSLMSFGMSLFGGAGGAKGSAVSSFNPDTINMSASVAGPMMSVGDLNSFPGLAAGGPAAANRPYFVGEFGKEVFVPNTDGRILPRSEFSSSSNTVIHITQNIPQEMSRHSANQLAADTGQQVNRALRRNG
jgi:hypothetical protein